MKMIDKSKSVLQSGAFKKNQSSKPIKMTNFVNEGDTSGVDNAASHVTADLAKLQIQMNILNYYIRNVLKSNENQNTQQLIKMLEILNQHDEKVDSILKRI
jgi:hypothetical protein